MDSYGKVKNWLLESGICILDTSDPNVGAVHSFYDLANKEFSFLYPEITGYYISTMNFLYNQENSQKYVDMARLCVSWLIKIYDTYGGIVMGIDSDKRKTEQIFSFDSAMCAKGLLDFYDITKEQKYREYSKKILDWIVEECVNDAGTVKPVMMQETKKFFESAMWYGKTSCFGIKLAMALLDYGDAKYREIATKICETYKKFQNENGSFALQLGSKAVNLHSHAYAMEGLLYAYSVIREERYLESVQKGLDWATSQIDEDGSIPLWFNFNYKSKAAYPLAQLIRLLVLVNKITPNLKYIDAARKLTDFIVSLQSEEKDKRANGGFYEEFYKSIFGWKKRTRVNSWTYMFALQALNWMENYENLSFENSIKYLY